MSDARAVVVCAVVAAAGLSVPRAVEAQQWSWPERAENLTELPPDFPPERLSAVMRGFSQALGVRCTFCHVGEEGQPLSTFDFVSDENPNKDRARAMYRMLGDINEHLADFEPSGAAVNMWCHTCHAGKPRPQTLAEALTERYEADGGEAAFELFTELRGRYYGAAAYDFTAVSVGTIAAGLAQQGDTATAYRFLEHNFESHPGHWLAQEGMGDVWLARGDTARAVELFERSLEGQPGNPRVARKLEGIRGG